MISLCTGRKVANNLLQPAIVRAVWSSVVVQEGVVPSFSDLLASRRAMAAEQGRSQHHIEAI
ncbi:MAG: hypothetical protein GY801_46540 [bacterium]|nr:hypothetical protein [bacterium]